MFEGSLVESRGLSVSQSQRWAALGSLTVQCAAAGLLLALPLLRPQALPMMSVVPRIAVPFVSRPHVQPVRVAAAAASPSAVRAPAAAPVQVTAGRPLIFPDGSNPVTDGPMPAIDPSLRMGGGPAINLLSTMSNGPVGPVVPEPRASTTRPVAVSTGVSEGLLLAPIRPVYPPIARIAGVKGTVVLEAIISKAGRIESLHVVSGPPMLQTAARDAVQAARYRPYLLNGEPVEVQTTIQVQFVLGS